ncbi:MAG: citramalate synthase [Firmicutes bacterium]|nr:citramalate synthase [Bacillota bacterium]
MIGKNKFGIEILDTTLRDGAQSEGVSYSVSDKINVVKALDDFGVNYIEAGNPGSNPKDLEFFKRAGGLKLKNAKLCAFGSTRRIAKNICEDENILSLLSAGTETVVIFGKASDLQVKEILNATQAENLEIIYDTVKFFKEKGKEVIFDAEHFFDGYKSNKAYAKKALKVASDAGADILTLCDTNGGALSHEVATAVKDIVKSFKNIRIGIHCHNDSGLAVANSLVAVECGATHVQGTFVGTGERAGNADLSGIIPNLYFKMGYDCAKWNLRQLTDTALKIYEISNIVPPANKPYTGYSAFAHKGGMHIDGMEKLESSFEHIPPESVGNKRRYLMSELSGKTTVFNKIASYAPNLSICSQEVGEILNKLKELEFEGYQFESAEASFELIVREILGGLKPKFEIKSYKTSVEYLSGNGSANASVEVVANGLSQTATASGNGPVNALDIALRKALQSIYPEIKNIYLTDYKVRVISSGNATGAKVRVLIENSSGKNIWTTVGVSSDIIEASKKALQDSFEYYLLKWGCAHCVDLKP